jgi:hypothetical protein
MITALSSFPLKAQLGQSSSYFCVGEFAAGAAFSDAAKKWQSTIFRDSDKFVLKLKFLGSLIRKDVLGQDETVYDYSVTLTQNGSNVARECRSINMTGKIVSVSSDYISCWSSLQDYRFNLKTNRFLVAYLHGFTDGVDESNKKYPVHFWRHVH